MKPSGVVVPDALASLTWERCPDWDGRFVLRHSKGNADWILWQGSPEILTCLDSSAGSHDARHWRGLAIVDSLGLGRQLDFAYLASVDDRSPLGWLGIALGRLQSVDVLVAGFGSPPHEIQADWQEQSASMPSPQVLSHLLVSSDGRLISLAAIEAALLSRSIRQSHRACLLDWPLSIPDRPALRDIPHAATTSRLRIDDLLSFQSMASPGKSDGGLRSRPTRSNSTLPQPSAMDSRLKPRRSHGRPWMSMLAAGLVLAGGLSLWLSIPPKRLVQRDSPSSNVDRQAEIPSPFEWPVNENDRDLPRELAGDVQTLPDAGLNDQAADALHQLLGRLDPDQDPESVDSISFLSLEAMFKTIDDESIVQQSLDESTKAGLSRSSVASAPFAESLEAVPIESQTSIVPETKSWSENSLLTEPVSALPGPGFVTQTFPIQQSQFQSTFRVPFKTNHRQAVCRARLTIAEEMRLKPTEAVSLVGHQESVWTVAFNDDSPMLAVYLRSVPAKSWIIATAVRLRISQAVERPMGPNDATQVCLRLENYVRWLDRNREIGESLRGDPKSRLMAIAGLEALEKQTKATQKSLKSWLAIEKLVRAFYRQNAFDLELAASADDLPPHSPKS